MKNMQDIEKLNSAQKWSVVLGTLILAAVACYGVSQRDGNLYSALFIYYIPLGFSAMLLGLNVTALLTLVVVVLSFLNFLSSSFPLWVYLTFFSSLGVNYFFWYQWSGERELKEFQYQKAKEELDLSFNDTQLAHEKIKTAHQTNLIKIQRYTAVNELARSLAMTFKTQDVVVLLIETISKTFMVPGGVYTLLMFDSSIGKALHAVRYSVDTEMEVRLRSEER